MIFLGEIFNNNENYFWFDSWLEGYVFIVCVVEVGDKFVIYDEMLCVVGDVVIFEVNED